MQLAITDCFKVIKAIENMSPRTKKTMKYIAQDESGRCFFYENKPTKISHEFRPRADSNVCDPDLDEIFSDWELSCTSLADIYQHTAEYFLNYVQANSIDITKPPKTEAQVEVESLSAKYRQYFRDFSDYKEVDTYILNTIFPVEDNSGCILHARKKLLIPSVRTGNKTLQQEVKEARDTLTRYLQIHKVE